MTRAQIRDLSRKRLGETTSAFWSDAELNQWINDSGHDIAFRTKCLRTNGLFTPVADQGAYTLTSHFPTLLSPLEVYYFTDALTWQKLDPTNRTDLDITHQGWQSVESGTPYQYWWDREEDTLYLFVPPSSDQVGTNYVKLYYCKDYTDLSADGTESGLPDRLHWAQVDYVVATGYETRGHGDKSNDAWGKYFKRMHDYQVERNREKEDDDLIMKNYRNV